MGLLVALFGIALALAVVLVPGMAKTARADTMPTHRLTETDPNNTEPLNENATLPYGATLQPTAQENQLWVGSTPVTSDNMSGEGWIFDATSNTLTLNGANITTWHSFTDKNESHSYGIYYTGPDPLTIVVASDSTVDISDATENDTAGIYCEPSELTITGEGKLTVKGRPEGTGISGWQKVTIDNGVVDATGGNGGINAREGELLIINGSTVETNGGIYGKRVTINGGTVKASGKEKVIFGDSVTISGGKVTVTASDGNAIVSNSNNYGPGTVTISGGTVIATGGAEGSGIYTQRYGAPEPPGIVKIGSGIASVTASGGKQAIEGNVINAVDGMGWTDMEGTTGKALIAISANPGQTLSYKKGQFPTPVAKVTTAPEATNPTYNGKAQELVTAGTAEGGTMQYSLDGKTWSEKIPTGTDAKSYTVWYKAMGDNQHADSEPQKVTSTITKLSGSGHVQTYGDVAAKASGAGIVIGTTGEAKRLEQFTVSLPKDTDGGIEYRAHLQRAGWGDWVEGGKPCGTTNEARRMEAVQMRLTGALAKTHSVWYRVHSQTWAWLGWARDGQAAGTSGQAKRAEAVEVQVLPQGQVPEGYVESEASYVGAVSADVHLQKIGWTGTSSALEFGTTGQARRLEAVRLSGPATPVAGGISYEAHVQREGWMPAVADGALAGTTGQARRLEAVRVSLTGDAAKDGGYSVWYRVHSQTYGWLGWAHDGKPAGTTGLAKRAEAIDVQVLPQGQVPRGYDASKAACVNK